MNIDTPKWFNVYGDVSPSPEKLCSERKPRKIYSGVDMYDP